VAIICGCSFLINSTIDDASIHLSASIPLVSSPCRIRSSRPAAFSSPNAPVSTLRIYSLESCPNEVRPEACVWNSSTVLSISSCVTLFNVDMAFPSFWTSLGDKNFSTDAASCSPNDISRIALFFKPSLSIVYPLFNYVGDNGRLLSGHAPDFLYVFLQLPLPDLFLGGFLIQQRRTI